MKRQSVRLFIVTILGLLGPLAQNGRGDFSLHNNEQLTVNSSHSQGYLYDTSRAFIVSGGSVDNLSALHSSTVDISGGSVNWLYAWDSSRVSISGGSVYGLPAHHFSTVDMSGGEVDLFYASSTLNMAGGYIDFLSALSCTSNISAGAVDFINTSYSSTVNVSGGSVNLIWTHDSSTVNISGGEVARLIVQDSSTVTFYGQNFLVSGGLVLDGRRVLGEGTLRGEWFDGTPWALGIGVPPTASVFVVPAPGAVFLGSIGLSFSGWLLRRRRASH